VRLLLDECVDRRLARDNAGHDVSTVVGLGWAGTRNGALLRRAQDQCEVFVTVDRNLAFQHPIDSLPFPVVVLRAKSNRLSDLRPLVPSLLKALPTLLPGEVKWIEA
jgi:predicted nuclease of predicted toxin-antitoxin system